MVAVPLYACFCFSFSRDDVETDWLSFDVSLVYVYRNASQCCYPELLQGSYPGWGRIAPLPGKKSRVPASGPSSAGVHSNGIKSDRRLSGSSDRVALARALRPATSSLEAPAEQSVAVPLKVVCQARTRVPTPHGSAFIHLYKNNHDRKEHLAFVIDKPQHDAASSSAPLDPHWIRSSSLDSQWHAGETAQERIVRGAFVGQLSPSCVASTSASQIPAQPASAPKEHVLVRIHSECFTGETIGSQRCDCGEQLDEAFRLIAASGQPGVIVYLRQEGRGIGLLEKLRAYNLQDLGHDTVSANLMLGHGSDERKYDLAAAILRDLGIASVKLMTNNPDKVEQAEQEGLKVVERVSMIPRSWRGEQDKHGVGMIADGVTRGADLDRYLTAKVKRMGHLLDIPELSTQPATPAEQDPSLL